MRGSVRSGALVLSVLLTAGACAAVPVAPGEEPDPDGEITTPVQSIPPKIDPLYSGSYDQIRHASMLFEGLMTFDAKTLAPIPAAAREQPRISPDGLTYTFTLREGLKYSDGSALTARDFVFAFSRVCTPGARPAPAFARLIAGCDTARRLDPKTNSADLAVAQASVGLQATSDTELVVTLSEPAPYFTAIAGLPIAFPVRERDVARARDTYGTQADVAGLIGNGPFRLVEWTPEQRLVFERNEHYRSPPRLKRWTKVVVPLDVALHAYRNGEIDFYGGAPSMRIASVNENMAVIEADPELRSQIVDGGTTALTDYFVLNVSRPPFTDRKVRQAFAKAIDRGAMVREFLKFSLPGHSLIPPGRPGHDPGDTFQAFDPAGARELLRSSSFMGRPELSAITLVYPAPPTRTPAEFLQQSLKRTLGIEITLELVDPTTYDGLFADPRTAPHIYYQRHIESFTDPHAWFAAFRSSSPFAAAVGYRNEELDALISAAATERDSQRRTGLYQRASRILSEDVLAIWFLWPTNTYLRKPRVKGVTDSPKDIEYGLLRITDIYVTKRR